MKEIIQKISDYSLEEIMGERFGRYSKYIIQDRAIPDVRDGLKPVQRRVVYAMFKMRNTYEKPYRKSANAVGEIMGKYHPHGDSSIYETMVRMSQDWKNNNSLVDMKGNNGSIDGDPFAASRYTEARLSKISGEFVRDLEKDTVKWAPNYDDKLLEPTVLPAKFPNLLVNGATGISAGYATNIPPHNLNEVIDGVIHRIDNPKSTLEQIMEYIKGPDLPTGGIIEGKDGIIDAYETGRGKIIVKCKYQFEKNKNLDQIIISEIPYETNKSNIIKKIAEIMLDKKVEGISDVRDETDRTGIRIAIDLKKEANKELIINYLLKNTDLQISYNSNMIAIVNRRPKLLGLLSILDAYIAHQKEIITKRSEFDLAHARKKYHIYEGLIKAIGILDEVIRTIRASKNKSNAEDNLVKEYQFTEEQAKYIVELQLYRLTNSDITEIESELESLLKIIKLLESILSDEKKLKKVVKDELTKIKTEYGEDRKSVIKDEITEIKIDTTEMIAKEDVVVVVTNEGYVKRVSLRSYNAVSDDETGLKENDYVIGLYKTNTLDTVLLFTDLGNYLYVPVYELPDLKWKDLGKHISNIIKIKPEENIISSCFVPDFECDKYVTIFTKNGMVKRTELKEFKVQRYSKPITAMKLKDKDLVTNVYIKKGTDIITTTKNGYSLIYSIEEVPVTGLKTSGVKSISLKNDEVVSGNIINGEDYLTIITDKGTAKRVKLAEINKLSRARKGTLIIRDVKTNPYYILKTFVDDVKNTLIIVTNKDKEVVKFSTVSINDRMSTGTTITKNKIVNIGKVADLIDGTEVEEIIKKEIDLKNVDDRILSISDYLDDFDL